MWKIYLSLLNLPVLVRFCHIWHGWKILCYIAGEADWKKINKIRLSAKKLQSYHTLLESVCTYIFKRTVAFLLTFTFDIWLKSANPSPPLKAPLPNGSSVPNGSGTDMQKKKLFRIILKNYKKCLAVPMKHKIRQVIKTHLHFDLPWDAQREFHNTIGFLSVFWRENRRRKQWHNVS